jgi:hypothetical protein
MKLFDRGLWKLVDEDLVGQISLEIGSSLEIII